MWVDGCWVVNGGCRSAMSCGALFAGGWLLIAGLCWSLVCDCWLPVVGRWMVGYWLLVVGCLLFPLDCVVVCC